MAKLKAQGVVYVVSASGRDYDPPEVWGVYSTAARASRERQAANVDHGRHKGTMGSFRVYPRYIDSPEEENPAKAGDR